MGAGASQKRKVPISKEKVQYPISNNQKIKSKVKCQKSKVKISANAIQTTRTHPNYTNMKNTKKSQKSPTLTLH